MSGRKPICNRFLKGECRAHNCKFYHPKQKHANHESKQHDTVCTGIESPAPYNTTGVTPPNSVSGTRQMVTHHQPTQTEHKKSISEIIYERMVNYDEKAERARERARAREQRINAMNAVRSGLQAQGAEQPVESIPTPVAKQGSFGAKLNSYTMPKFNKIKFQEWLYTDMPNIDGISIINLYSKLLKLTEDDILVYCNKSTEIIPDIMALLGNGLTNKKWLKELYGRFLGDSYTGIKSFNMKQIKDLLTFTLVQIYVKTCDITDTARLANIEKIICLYVCIMRIIGKLGIILEIDDINTIEKNYNSNKYEMFCN